MKRIGALAAVMLLSMNAAPRAQAPAGPAGTLDPRIIKLLDSVSEERLQQLLTKLVSFGTRNTLSDQTSTTRKLPSGPKHV